MKGARNDQVIKMNFSWLEHNRVAGCRGPQTKEDLAFLASAGIKALVRLAEPHELQISSADVSASKIEDYPEPVTDGTAPSQAQIKRVVHFINDSVRGGRPTAVSCYAGCGRTGTILACYLVSQGNGAEDAIRNLISKRPCSRELLNVPGQKEAVQAFAATLNKT
jgi:atypical dual specificity phosphatase